MQRKTRRLVATMVAMVFVVCQIFLATHIHSDDFGSHKSATSYACSVCLVKATSHDLTGPVPAAPVVGIATAEHFVGAVLVADEVPSVALVSAKWARGPPAVAASRATA